MEIVAAAVALDSTVESMVAVVLPSMAAASCSFDFPSSMELAHRQTIDAADRFD